MQTIVYQCDTAMPAQKLPNCCLITKLRKIFELGSQRVAKNNKIRAYFCSQEKAQFT